MKRRFLLRCLLLFVLLPAALPDGRADDAPVDLRLTLPRQFFAVVGEEMSVYFDNVVLSRTPERFRFDVQCDIGRTGPDRWTVQPTMSDVGRHAFLVAVRNVQGELLEQARSTLIVVPRDAGAGRSVTMLIVGDSLTHATVYPNELARLLSRPDNPDWAMLGTHVPGNAAAGVRHEGYGGWTWQRFAAQYEPDPDGTYRKRSSPFVFSGERDGSGRNPAPDNSPRLDVARYLAETADGQRPDVVFFLLGINDCFHADPDDPAAIDARIDAMFTHADTLLAEFRRAAPQTDLAVCVTTPPNVREAAFEANYKGRYHRWGWKRIQHRLVERLIEHFARTADSSDSSSARVFLVPTQLNLDPVKGYPENNGVHPNAFGYRQIGGSLYAWLKWRLSQPPD